MVQIWIVRIIYGHWIAYEMSENIRERKKCGICNLPYHQHPTPQNLQICLTCSAIFQLDIKPEVKRSLELLRTITVEGNGFVEIDGNEFIIEGNSGLGYRISIENPFKMNIQCYRSKYAALNPRNEICMRPCVDLALADESKEIPIGDLVFTYAMALTNDLQAAEEIETLDECIELRDLFRGIPPQDEWNEEVLKIRKRASQWRFGGPFPVEGGIGEQAFHQMAAEIEEEQIEFMDNEAQEMLLEMEYEQDMLEMQYQQDMMEIQRQQEEEQENAISPDFPEWTQERLERFMEIMDRLRENIGGD